ncbi:MAG: divergent PAP2 family protein [Erysipelotrichaceae bacterium]|nr:divergent PAP2 family protein [Erysipelotrichaceae bacterium]
MQRIYPFIAAVSALVLAQVVKPFLYRRKNGEWDWITIIEGGGLPSSHSSLVTALTLSVGLQEGFSSTAFAISLAFSLIIMFDAFNVRWYAGKNNEVTKQLIKDLQEKLDIELDNPIYEEKLKPVLGHKASEVLAGLILGLIIAIIYYYILWR